MDKVLIIPNIFATGIVFTYIIILFIMGSNVKSTRILAIINIGVLVFLINIIIIQKGYPGLPWYTKYASFFFPVLYILYLLTETLEKAKPGFFLFLLVPVTLLPFADYDLLHIIYHVTAWPLSMLFIFYIMKRYKMENRAIKEKFYFFIVLNVIIVLPFLIQNIILFFLTGEASISLNMFPISFAVSSLISLGLIYNRNLIRLNHAYYENLSFIKKASAFEKLTIIEKVSAGLIHEIKNPLTAVKSLVQQLNSEDSAVEPEEAKEFYTTIEEEIVRMEELCSSFLQVQRKEHVPSEKPFNLKEKVGEVTGLIGFELKKHQVDLKVDIPGELSVLFNPYRFHQIILNLIYNAIEAGASGITVTAEENSEAAVILVTDNGKGIPEEIKNMIFKPFFTTKEQGTGMGLVICREILHNNGGNLYLVESKGQTAFKIVLYKEKK